jgi:WD40 repeat protein
VSAINDASVVSGARDNTVRVWDVASGSSTVIAALSEFVSVVHVVAPCSLYENGMRG